MTIEQQIDKLVEDKINKLLPQIIKTVKQELIFKQVNQTLFTQKEMAERQHVSVSTFKKWRKMGLQSASSPSGKLLFDLNEVNKWRTENDLRKSK